MQAEDVLPDLGQGYWNANTVEFTLSARSYAKIYGTTGEFETYGQDRIGGETYAQLYPTPGQWLRYKVVARCS